MSRKKIKKSSFTSLCDWLVGYYSFNLSFALKPIAPVSDAQYNQDGDYTAAMYSLVN